MAKVTFNNNGQAFFAELKQSVDQYFAERRLKKTGNWKLYTKTIILLPAAVGIYLFLLFGTYTAPGGILLSGLMGLTLVAIAFNVMHDACHGSYSRHKWVNETMGLTTNALGGNAFLWKIKHNIIHHTYTNVNGVDDDIAFGPLLRLCATQKRRPLHRFQFIYMFFFYAVGIIAWVLVFDFAKYFSKKIHNTPINKIEAKEHVIFWLSKLLYVFFYGLLPVYVVGWGAWLTGFLIMQATVGLLLSIVFQLAHVVEKTAFEEAGDAPKIIATEWAVHEVRTTANFAPKNKIISWFVGGLNYQIEHHLFPRISHVHYAAISKIVEEKCRQFVLPYHSYPTTRAAIASHIRVMKQLGKQD